jgi:hypothetical protein
MAKDKHGEPPLESVVELSYSEKTGPLIVTHRQRGFLIDLEATDIKKARRTKPSFRPNGTVALDALRQRLRRQLDASGLPTDKWPVTPIELDFGYDPKEHGIVADDDLWIGCVEDSTEPLTKDRIAADLLHAINRLLIGFTDDQLSDVFRAMRLYHLNSMVGDLNELAIAGTVSRKSMGKGPQVKKERARNYRKLILAIAEDFWARDPKWRGQPVNTAKKITKAVNEMRANREPGCKPLAVTTIANHLRVALRETAPQ